MNENGYRIVGWAIFGFTIIVALNWCLNGTGLAGWILHLGEDLFQIHLGQTAWVVTIAVLCFPGYLAKRYFDQQAWNAHVDSLPPPDVRTSAMKSKYVQLDAAQLSAPPKPVEIKDLPPEQMEFIATCAACGHLFSARRDEKDLKCPNCGENLPTGA